MTALAPNHYNIINAIQGTLSNVRNSRNKQNYATIKQPMQLMLLEFAEKPFTNVYRLTQLYLQSKNRTLTSFAERTYVHFCHHHHHDHHYHHHHHGLISPQEDAGVYTCTASNGVGSPARAFINLQVLCEYGCFY